MDENKVEAEEVVTENIEPQVEEVVTEEVTAAPEDAQVATESVEEAKPELVETATDPTEPVIVTEEQKDNMNLTPGERYNKKNKNKKKNRYQKNSPIVTHQDTPESYTIELKGSTSNPGPEPRIFARNYRVKDTTGKTVEKFTDVSDAIRYANKYLGYKVINEEGKLVHCSTTKLKSAHDANLNVKSRRSKILTPLQGIYLDEVYGYKTSTSKQASMVLSGSYKIINPNPKNGRLKIGRVIEDWKGKHTEIVGWVDEKYV